MRKLTLLLGMVACTAIGIIGIQRQSREGPKTVNDLSSLIQERVPIGSSRQQVLAFLSAEGIEHSEYIPVEGELHLNDNEPKEKSTLIRGRIYAAIRNVETDSSANWGLFMRFYFDDKGTLIDYRIQKSGTPFNNSDR